MVGTVLDKVAGRVDQRFLSTSLFPGFLFLAGVGSLVATQIGWTRTLAWWSALDGSRRGLLVAAAVTVTLLYGLLVTVRLRALIRLFEGYWPSWLASPGRKLQERRRAKITDFEQQYYLFPTESLLPTRLGNVLRAAEDYPGSPDRYEMDGVFFWPRLYSVLPDHLRALLGDSRSDLERLLVISSNAALFALVSLGFAVFGDIPLSVWLPLSVGATLLCVTAYRGAVRAAIGYGDLVRTAFDVHRRDLLLAMGLELPATLGDERKLWRSLGQQLYRGLCDEPDRLKLAPPPAHT